LPVLRQLLNEPEVTPGPWAAEGRAVIGPVGFSEMPVVAEDYGVVLHEDAALIAAAVTALPALLDRLERQAAAIEAVQAEMQNWAKRCPEDDWGSGDIADMVLADAGRHVLSKIENHLSGITPTTEENP
jgi:L-rhamnose isomerase